LAQVESLQTSVRREQDVVQQLAAWDEQKLLLYWTRNRDVPPEFPRPLADLELALIHQDYRDVVPTGSFTVQKPYFRLIYRGGNQPATAAAPAGFSLKTVKMPQAAQMVVELIGRCYQELQPSVATILSWTRQPVFDPELWLWVVDEGRDVPVGLGIADLDRDIGEGSLEWIQVLPEYRGQGLGRFIVLALLARLEQRAAFTTVAGLAGDLSNPEALYRRCGFSGSDVWWLLS
jgi:GNAT superfamily N-acetyltransferase